MLTKNEKEQIRKAVKEAMRYYPNSHLGDCSPREDMRSAFRSIRNARDYYGNMWEAATYVYNDAQRYADM